MMWKVTQGVIQWIVREADTPLDALRIVSESGIPLEPHKRLTVEPLYNEGDDIDDGR